MHRRHLEDARERIRPAADATSVHDLDDQPDSIDEALGDVDGWNDEDQERLRRIRDELAETETRIEDDLGDDLEQPRVSLGAYGRRVDR